MSIYVPVNFVRAERNRMAKAAEERYATLRDKELSRLTAKLKDLVAWHARDHRAKTCRLCAALLNYREISVELRLSPQEVGRLISECLLDGEDFEVKT